jgi:histidinol-phosphate aminotransferase
MFIQRKNYLSRINRLRVSEGRSLDTGLRLDRNEKVDIWEKGLLAKIFSEKPDYFLSVYPESSNVYKKIAAFHQVEESQLILTSGIDGGLKTIFEVMTEPGDLVGVASPTYAMYKIYANLFQVTLSEIEYTEDLKFNFAAFDAFLEQKPTVFFLPNPNQPIESAFTINELREFAKKTLDKNCLFIIDEAYHMFGCDSGIDLIKEFENIVVTRTFSKGFGVPSIRLGYMISSKENMSILAKTRLAHESNSLTNAVAEYLLDNYEMVKQYNQSVIESRDEVKEILHSLGINTHGSNGNYLLLDMGNADRAKQFVGFLKEREIYVKGPWSSPRDKYITITIGPITLMQRFVKATQEFLNKK